MPPDPVATTFKTVLAPRPQVGGCEIPIMSGMHLPFRSNRVKKQPRRSQSKRLVQCELSNAFQKQAKLPKRIIWAIVGSERVPEETFAESIMKALETWRHAPSHIIYGGCRGLDNQLSDWARGNGYGTKKMEPDWQKHGSKAGQIRNRDMIATSTHVLVFLRNGNASNLTKDAKEQAMQQNRPIIIVPFDP